MFSKKSRAFIFATLAIVAWTCIPFRVWPQIIGGYANFFLAIGAGSVSRTFNAKMRDFVDVRDFGALCDTSTNDTTAFTNAIASLTTGRIELPFGTCLHTGITLKAGVVLNGKGAGATFLKNTNSSGGDNVTIPALANRAGLRQLTLTTAQTASGRALYIEDALWTRFFDFEATAAGNNKPVIELNTLNNPGGNGAYWAEFIGANVDCNNATGSIGIKLNGTAAGANSNHFYGTSIRNCAVVGVDIVKGSLNVFYQPYISASTLAMHYEGPGAVANSCYSCWMESNTSHLTIDATAADNLFIQPQFSTPNAVGSDNGSRTVMLGTSNSVIPNKLPGGLTFAAGGVTVGSGDFAVSAGKVSATTSFEETSALTASIPNTSTFDITVPTPRRTQLLTVYSGTNLNKNVLYLVFGDGAGTINASGIVTNANITAAGFNANTVRVTNSLGIAATFRWTLTPLGVGL